ncbi:hypothetical protein CEW46_32035, partial [Bacillus cereus]
MNKELALVALDKEGYVFSHESEIENGTQETWTRPKNVLTINLYYNGTNICERVIEGEEGSTEFSVEEFSNRYVIELLQSS